NGGHRQARAKALAAVPVETHKASTSCSNSSEKTILSRPLHASPSYATSARFAAPMAARTSEQTEAALSEKKRMTLPAASRAERQSYTAICLWNLLYRQVTPA